MCGMCLSGGAAERRHLRALPVPGCSATPMQSDSQSFTAATTSVPQSPWVNRMKRVTAACAMAGLLAGLALAYTDAWAVVAPWGPGRATDVLRHLIRLVVPYLLAGACVGLVWAGCIAAVRSCLGRRWEPDQVARFVRWMPLAAVAVMILRLHTEAGPVVHKAQPGFEALVIGVLLCVAGWLSARERTERDVVPAAASALGALGALVAFCPLTRILERPGWGWGLRLTGQALAVLLSAVAGYLLYRLVRWVAQAMKGGVRARWATLGALAAVGAVLLGVGVPKLLEGPNGRTREAPLVLPAREAARSETASSPNVILISVDTLRPDFLGCNGGRARTPNIDALAAQSHVFETPYTVAPWTRPSFAAFLSGRYPSEMGVGRAPGRGGVYVEIVPYEWRTEHVRLAEVFQQAGYFAAAVVTNPHLTHEAHADRGFDFYLNCEVDPPEEGSPQQTGFGAPTLQAFDALLPPFLPGTQKPEEVDRSRTARAEYVIHTAGRLIPQLPEGPTLLWFHFMDPHHPYDPPTIPPEERVGVDHREVKGGTALRAATERETCLRAYTSEIEYFDHWFEDLIESLQEAGLWDSSIIVFWSDHGEEFWEHGGWEHGASLFNEVLRVPLMVRLPGQTVGARHAEPACLLDAMPTLLDLCDLEPPADLPGRSLAPVFEGRPDEMPPLKAFVEGRCRGGMEKGLITERYKLIYRLYEDSFQLYDLVDDPTEQHNIHGMPMAPDTAQWEAELREWSMSMVAEATRDEGETSVQTDPQIRDSLRDLGYAQ